MAWQKLGTIQDACAVPIIPQAGCPRNMAWPLLSRTNQHGHSILEPQAPDKHSLLAACRALVSVRICG